MTDQIIVQYKADVEGFKAEMKSVESSIKKVETTSKKSAEATTKNFQSASSSIKNGAMQIAGAFGVAFGVSQVVNFGKEAVVLAGKLEGVEKAFKKLNRPELLEELRKATKGTVSDLVLMQTAVKAKNFQLPLEQLGGLLKFAQQRAQETGESVEYLTESIVLGIARKSIPILDNLGISSVQIQKEFQKTGDFAKAVGNIVNKSLQEQGDLAETTADKMAKINVVWEEFKASVGKYLINEGAELIDNFDVVFGGKADAVALKNRIGQIIPLMDEVNAKTLMKARESELGRLNAIVQTNKNIIALHELRGKQETFQQQKVIDAQIRNQKDLLGTLRHINDVAQTTLSEEELKAIQEAHDKAEELRIKLRDLETENIRSNYERRKKEIQNNFDDEAKKYAGHQDILHQLDIKRENALLDLYNEREKEYEKIRKEGANKSVEIFKASAEEMKAEDTALAVHVKNNQDEIVKKVEEAEKRKQRAQEQTQNAISSSIDSLGQLSQNLTEQELIDLDKKTEKEISSLEYQLDHKLITQQEYDSKVAALEKKKDEEQRRLRKEQFETDRQIAIAKIIIATAQAVITQFAETGYYGAILAGVVGAAELAVVASQPTPKFEKGGKVKGKRHSAGGTLIEAEVDEFVVKRDEAMKNDPLLNAINKGKADSFIYDFYVAPALKAQQKKNAENREKSFANNLAGSLGFNFKDKNLLESLKQSRKNDRENTLFLARELKPRDRDARRF